MKNEVLTPTPIKPLLDISEVQPYNENDKPCFDDIVEVLKKHNALDRFGVTLLHGHFEVADDEILVEEVDSENRTLTIQPKKLSELKSISTTATSWRLDTGQAMASCVCRNYGNGHACYPVTSDIRLKKEINEMKEGALNKILDLKTTSYFYKTDEQSQLNLPSSKQFGLIAQEVEKIIPELVVEQNGYKAINYNGLIAFLIKAVQEQQETIGQLQNEIKELSYQTA